jgi:hypothetical protein
MYQHSALEGIATSSFPVYTLGDVVRYLDRRGREQTGAVVEIKAVWRGTKSVSPKAIYSISHPTHNHLVCHVTIERIL